MKVNPIKFNYNKNYAKNNTKKNDFISHSSFAKNSPTDAISFTYRIRRSCYAIRKDGWVSAKYETAKSLAQDLNISIPGTSNCLNGKARTVGEYYIVSPNEIEDEFGRIDKNKVQLVIMRKKINTQEKKSEKKEGIYQLTINYDAKYYQNKEAAQENSGYSVFSIDNSIKNQALTDRKYIFVKAGQVEDKNGELDLDKVKEVVDNSKAFQERIYTLTEAGEISKYPTYSAMIDELGLDRIKVQAAFRTQKPYEGLAFIKPFMIEDENHQIDEVKKQKLIDRYFKKTKPKQKPATATYKDANLAKEVTQKSDNKYHRNFSYLNYKPYGGGTYGNTTRTKPSARPSAKPTINSDDIKKDP